MISTRLVGRRYLPQNRQPSPVDVHMGLAQIPRIADELEALKRQYEAALTDLKASYAEVLKVQKGDKGDPGTPANDTLITESVIQTVLREIPSFFPKDGEDGQDADMQSIVDAVVAQLPKEESIVASVLAKIQVPEAEDGADGTDADPEAVIAYLNANPGKLNIKHIAGLEGTIRSLSSGTTKPYLHGGGVPSLTAGSNVTLTRNSDGGYTVSSSGGGGGTFYAETPSGTIDGSNATFTTAHTIATVLSFSLNGMALHLTTDYTFTGTTITFVSPPDSSLSGKGFTIVYV